MRGVSLILLLLLTRDVSAIDGRKAPVAFRQASALPAGLSATSPGQWTWAGGSDLVSEIERLGAYGTKGVPAPENVPGARHGAAAWVDASGDFWLFGGRGVVRNSAQGVLNDLWRWDGASWTWVSGSNTYGQVGVYGSQGVAAPGNFPGARHGAVSWTDATGDFWLFGGEGRGSVSSVDVLLCDLWRWDGTSWTWVSGPDVGSQPGIYGTIGIAAPENRPGARRDASAWADESGVLWLFGGYGLGAGPTGRGGLNDLWMWNGTAWAWISGSSDYGAPGIYGAKGVPSPANVPGGRSGSAATIDPDGTVWLFGGDGKAASGSGWLNDLWRWDGTVWTWMSGANVPDQGGTYGTKGVPDPANVPGARAGAISWTDPDGSLLLLGGADDPLPNDWNAMSDLWRWDGASWTWIGGASAEDQPGMYGTKGVPAPGNEPGARSRPAVGRGASGSVLVFGGRGSSATGRVGPLNDLWLWTGTQWTWLAGSTGAAEAGVYGTKGLASPGNRPGARTGAVTWRTPGGDAWLFGGYGYSARGLGYLNDLWRWDGAAWAWMSGADFEGQPGAYGTKGTAASSNVPGARSGAVAWTDDDGNLWLFGGVDDPWEQSLRNDLWKWDGVSWTWVSGSQDPGDPGTYGTKGVPAPGNVPPCRHGAASWASADGHLWLFGGNGWPVSLAPNLNDLWRWDGVHWTWMSGSRSTEEGGHFGALGVPAPANAPPGRKNSAAWVDHNGHFWLFGGLAYWYDWYNDFWRWDGVFWTWMGGSGRPNEAGIYGTLGVAAPGNRPGARYGANAWTDGNGNLWLQGGEWYGLWNDLWRFDGVNWAWMAGAADPNQAGLYGDLGVPSPDNTPGGRRLSASWADSQGRLWLFGGRGFDSSAAIGTLRDTWVYEPRSCVPPSALISAPDSVLEGSGPHPAAVADGGAGTTYEWSADGATIDTGQGTAAITFTPAPGAADISLAVVVRRNGCAASSARMVPVGVFFRLDIVRNGYGRITYTVEGSPRTCGMECSAVVAQGASAALVPWPEPGSRFAGWLGGGCSGTGNCTVTMDEAKTVSATFFPSSPAGFYPVTPCRIVDTRNAVGPYGAPPLAAGASRLFVIGGLCGVPSDAAAVALNVTVTAPTESGFLTLHPGSGPAPESTSIHFAAGRTRANNVTMGLAEGALSVLDRQATGTVELIIDVSGYYR